MPAHRYVEEISSAAILAAKRSAGVTPELNLREHVIHMSLPSANKAAHSGFEPRRDVTRCPKRGISGPTERTYVTYVLQKKIFKKKMSKKTSQHLGNIALD